ncbi:MAG: DNA repair protein RecO [Wenzhouxiangellaceae bacterium]
MIRHDRVPAYVLHRRAWRESSLIIELFTRDCGRIAVVARGVRSRRSAMFGLAEPFRPLEASWSRRGELGTLTRLEPFGNPLALRARALWCGLYVNELLMRLLPRDLPEPGLFNIYASTLVSLPWHEAQAWALRRLELELLDALGVLPELGRCAVSDEVVTPEGRYRVESGRGVVPAAPGQAGIRGATLLALAEREPPPAQELRAVRLLMRQLISDQLDGRPLHTPALLQETLR